MAESPRMDASHARTRRASAVRPVRSRWVRPASTCRHASRAAFFSPSCSSAAASPTVARADSARCVRADLKDASASAGRLDASSAWPRADSETDAYSGPYSRRGSACPTSSRELGERFVEASGSRVQRAEQPVKSNRGKAVARSCLAVLLPDARARDAFGGVEITAGDEQHRRLEVRVGKLRIQRERALECV